jgi:hypothetical protein
MLLPELWSTETHAHCENREIRILATKVLGIDHGVMEKPSALAGGSPPIGSF